MGKEFGVESTSSADIFDLQHHLELTLGRYLSIQMVRHVSMLNCIAVGPGSNLDGAAGKEFFIHCCFPMFRMALYAVNPVT